MSITQRPSSYHRSSPKLKPSFPSTIDFTFNKPKRSQSLFKLKPEQPLQPKLYELDFDYGKLSIIKSNMNIQAPARANTPIKKDKLIQSVNNNSNKPLASSISKFSNFSTKAKFSSKSKYSNYNNSNNSKGRGSDYESRRSKPLQINGVNLKFEQMFNPDEQKKNKTRVVTMLVGGKIINRTITYPDTSHYLKLCGIKKS